MFINLLIITGIIGIAIIIDIATLPLVAFHSKGNTTKMMMYTIAQMSFKTLVSISLTLLAFN